MTGKATGSFGPVAVSASGETYQVVIDSVIADVTPIRFSIRIGDGLALSRLPEKIPSGTPIYVVRLDETSRTPSVESGYQIVSIPVYIGVGARLTATVRTKAAGLNLSNLLAIASSVEAGESSGSITMQTLGIYGPQVASAFPIPSELNATSVQNALVSLGAVKAILYDGDTGTRPRLVGIYNPLPTSDPELINKIFAELSREPVPWAPCGSS